MKKPEFTGAAITKNENGVEMATIPRKLLNEMLLYIEQSECPDNTAEDVMLVFEDDDCVSKKHLKKMEDNTARTAEIKTAEEIIDSCKQHSGIDYYYKNEIIEMMELYASQFKSQDTVVSVRAEKGFTLSMRDEPGFKEQDSKEEIQSCYCECCKRASKQDSKEVTDEEIEKAFNDNSNWMTDSFNDSRMIITRDRFIIAVKQLTNKTK